MPINCDMPEDVIFNILLWLPVVSLLRFKSVCKSWCSLIGSSTFITQHLHHRTILASKDNDQIIAFDPEQSTVHSCTSSSFSLLSGDKFELCEILDLPVPYESGGCLPNIIASCNGIICLCMERNIIMLWNPAIKQYKVLPQSAVPLLERDNNNGIYHGFGFDAENNHYKVVRVVVQDPHDLQPKCRAEVYNLSNDTWRSIDAAFSCNYLDFDPKVPYQNGIYFWLGSLYTNIKPNVPFNSILTFDFTSEVFGNLSLPEVYSWQRCLLQLSILRGNIACIHWNGQSSEMDDWHFKIWVLTEYGVQESWTKLYTIRLTYQAWVCSRGFSKNGKLFVLLEDKKCLCAPLECICNNKIKVALCDCHTHEVSFLPIQMREDFLNHLEVVMHNESLVSIKGASGEANRATCTYFASLDKYVVKDEFILEKVEWHLRWRPNVVKARKKKDIIAAVTVQAVTSHAVWFGRLYVQVTVLKDLVWELGVFKLRGLK
ncbi:F-box protein cpr1 [Thalictrum thalictroides]|uniref:F-box protein cpr1 n=1 Tax=Thalictrum thalictroides TaxID=46969 RepID=A0A7J6VA35_THATH|nr:F-box protein cpr1 [Thalictrum thalictroides]